VHTDRLSLAPHDRSDLVCLKLYDGQPSYFSIAEMTTPDRCPLLPAMNRIPCDSLDSSDSGLVQTFGTQGAGAGVDAKVHGLLSRPTGTAQVSAALSPSGLVEAVADDMSSSSSSRQRTVPLWTAETLGPCRQAELTTSN